MCSKITAVLYNLVTTKKLKK